MLAAEQYPPVWEALPAGNRRCSIWGASRTSGLNRLDAATAALLAASWGGRAASAGGSASNCCPSSIPTSTNSAGAASWIRTNIELRREWLSALLAMNSNPRTRRIRLILGQAPERLASHAHSGVPVSVPGQSRRGTMTASEIVSERTDLSCNHGRAGFEVPCSMRRSGRFRTTRK